VPLSRLKAEFGPKTGQQLYNHCRGVDDRAVVSTHVRKSVSAEMNYGIRFTSDEQAESFLKDLAVELCSRMERLNVKCFAVTLKLAVSLIITEISSHFKQNLKISAAWQRLSKGLTEIIAIVEILKNCREI
jgi:nucleotidyltransferase/DNA polymerase involved in DNA repair